jgi:hypothetical protein
MRKSRAAVLVAAGVVAAVLAAAALPALTAAASPPAGTETSTTVLSADNNPAVTGQEITFTANVSGADATPTGTVTFEDGNTNTVYCDSVGLDDNGDAQCQLVNGLPADGDGTVNSYSVVAVYSGDDTYAGSQDNLTETVTPAATTTSVSADNNPAVTGQEVTFTADIAVTAPGTANPAPSGNVEFQSNGADIAGCSAVVVSSSAAQCSLPTGFAYDGGTPYAITTIYSGDDNFTTSTGTLNGGETVNQASTSTTLASSPTTPVAGQSVTFTATVKVTSPGSANPAPTGTVEFEQNGVALSGCSSVNLSGNTASCTESSGVHGLAVTALYSGDTNFVTSQSTAENVRKASASVTVTSSKKTTVAGQLVTYVATISSATSPESLTPTGTITFAFYGTGTPPTCNNGGDTQTISATSDIVTCAVNLLPSETANGVLKVTAAYNGDTNFNVYNDIAGVNQTVNQDTTTLSVTASPTKVSAGSEDYLVATVVPVAPGGGAVTGTVVFTIKGTGGTLLTCAGTTNNAVTLNAGSAVCELVDVLGSAAPYKVTAKYDASQNYGGSTGKVTLNVKPS